MARNLSLRADEDRRMRQDADHRAYHQALAISQQSAAADQIRTSQLRARELAETRDMAEALKQSYLDKGKGRQRRSSAERREAEELAAVLALSLAETGRGDGWQSAEGFAGQGSHAVSGQAAASPPRRVTEGQRRMSAQRFYVANPDEPEPTLPAYEAITLAPLPANPNIIGPGQPAPSASSTSPAAGPSRSPPASTPYHSPVPATSGFGASQSSTYARPIEAAVFSDSPDNRSWGHGDDGAEDDGADPFDEARAAVGHLVRSPAGPRPKWARTDSEGQTESENEVEPDEGEHETPVVAPRLGAGSRMTGSSRETMDLWGLTHRDTLARRQNVQAHVQPQPILQSVAVATAEPHDDLETPVARVAPIDSDTAVAPADSLSPSLMVSPSPSSSIASTPQPSSPRLLDPTDVPNSGGLVDTSSIFPPEERVLEGVAWGFISAKQKAQHLPLEHAGAFPDVAQLSLVNDEYGSFVFEAPSWGRLLVYLCWFGNARLEGEFALYTPAVSTRQLTV